MIVVETDTGTVDLSSTANAAEVASFTVPKNGIYGAYIRLTACNNDNATISCRVVHYSGASALIGRGATVANVKATASGATATVFSNLITFGGGLVYADAGEILKISLLPSIAQPATVAFTVQWIDMFAGASPFVKP